MSPDKSVNNHAKHTGPRKWLFWAAIALAVGEFIDALFVEVPAPGIIYAIMVAACAWWLRSRGGRAPIIILLVLATFELAAIIFIFYPNSDDRLAFWRLAPYVLLAASVGDVRQYREPHNKRL